MLTHLSIDFSKQLTPVERYIASLLLKNSIKSYYNPEVDYNQISYLLFISIQDENKDKKLLEEMLNCIAELSKKQFY